MVYNAALATQVSIQSEYKDIEQIVCYESSMIKNWQDSFQNNKLHVLTGIFICISNVLWLENVLRKFHISFSKWNIIHTYCKINLLEFCWIGIKTETTLSPSVLLINSVFSQIGPKLCRVTRSDSCVFNIKYGLHLCLYASLLDDVDPYVLPEWFVACLSSADIFRAMTIAGFKFSF